MQGSEKLYSSRKSFTALKSCYHRNFDVFKQIYLFEAFLTRAPNASSRAASPGTPSSSASAREVGDLLHAPIPASFDTPQERQTWLEKKLDAARALEIPIANLNVKVIDNWHERGWYPMFKRRSVSSLAFYCLSSTHYCCVDSRTIQRPDFPSLPMTASGPDGR